jgi:DNA-binding LacI/PurR family transcriptional regulator
MPNQLTLKDIAGLKPCLLVGSNADHPTKSLNSEQALFWARDWMNQSNHPTAVMTYELRTAILIYQAAMQSGLNVGSQFALHTFSTQRIDSWALPMTYSQVDEFDMGIKAVQMLSKLLDGDEKQLKPVKVPLRHVPLPGWMSDISI